MALWKAYIDESLDGDGTRALAVGGYLLRADSAHEMEAKWKAACDARGVTTFHMKDLARKNQGAFHHLRFDERANLYQDLIAIIKHHVTTGFCSILNPKRFSGLGVHNAYETAVVLVLSEFLLVADRQDQKAEVFLTIEDGQRHKKVAERGLNRFKEILQASGRTVPSHAFVPKQQSALLQSADILTWHARKYVLDLAEGKRPPRKDFLALTSERHAFAYVSDEPDTKALNLSRDDLPSVPHSEKDEYTRALFSDGQDADLVLKKWHEYHDARGASIKNPLYKGS